MAYSIIGLSFHIIGILLLFRFNILLNKILVKDITYDKVKKKQTLFFKITLTILLFGFILQLYGTIIQNNKIDSQLDKKILGEDCLSSIGICGDLKIKYDENLMYYTINVKAKKTLTDSISYFTIELQDEDGFKIHEINQSIDISKNDELSYHPIKDSINYKFKGSVDFSNKDYSKIKKWDLLCGLKNPYSN